MFAYIDFSDKILNFESMLINNSTGCKCAIYYYKPIPTIKLVKRPSSNLIEYLFLQSFIVEPRAYYNFNYNSD